MFGIPQRDESKAIDAKAFTEALFEHHSPALFAFLLQQTSSREDAEDILLDVFMAALEAPHLGHLPDEHQRLWLWRTTRNKIVDAYRRRQRRPSVPVEQVLDDLLSSSDQGPDETLLRWEEYSELHAALQALPLLQQRVLRLRFVNGLRSAEIATLVGKSETAVRALLSRTLNQLRRLYRERKK